METLDLQEAADFLKMHKETLRTKAKAGEIPGKKAAKRWVFLKKRLEEWLDNPYIDSADARQGGNEKCKESHYSKEKTVRIGGTGSQDQTVKEYGNLLELAIKKKRKK